MKDVKSLLPVLIACVAFLITPRVLDELAHAYTVATLTTSGDVGLLPSRSDILLHPLAADDPAIRVSGADAMAVAEREYSLQDSEVDASIGVVRATVSVQGDELRQDLKVWIVTANRDLTPPGPFAQGVFHKLCIVVDVNDGQYLFAYPTDWEPTNYSPITSASNGTENGGREVWK